MENKRISLLAKTPFTNFRFKVTVSDIIPYGKIPQGLDGHRCVEDFVRLLFKNYLVEVKLKKKGK